MQVKSFMSFGRKLLCAGLLAGLASCSSTDIYSPKNFVAGGAVNGTKTASKNAQSFALAIPKTANDISANTAKQRREQADKTAAEKIKREKLLADQKLAAAKQNADREAKRLAALDKLMKGLTEQQQAFFKPQRDQIQSSVEKSEQAVSSLTPKPKVHASTSSTRSSVGGGKSKYNALIAQHARANGIPINLAHAVVRVESSYRPNARGSAGEIGLMQLRLSTARLLGYKGSAKGLYDPATNIKYGMLYLGKAHGLAKGSTCGTILKYNAGHGATKMNPISSRYCKRVKSYI